MNSKKGASRSSQLIAGLSLSILWGVGLFGVFEADVWTAKLLILSALPPLSFGLDKFFYGL